MFLHSGAGLHGHEYSKRPSGAPPQNILQRRSPLLRHSLAHPVSRNQDPSSILRPTRPIPSIHTSASPSVSTDAPTRRFSSYTPPPPASRHTTTNNSTTTTTTTRSFTPTRPIHRPLSTFSNSPGSPLAPRLPRPVSDYIPRPEQVVRFKAPDPRPKKAAPPTSVLRQPDTMSEYDGYSASDLSDVSQGNSSSIRRKKRRQSRKSTTLIMAHPPPRQNVRTRLIQLRPQLLIQLQLLSPGTRPRPSLDVFPSSITAGSGIAKRISHRFPRVFRTGTELGPHDVLIVKSENYDDAGEDASDDEEENIGKRELIAVLSPLVRDARAEIVLADGTVWTAAPVGNGSFEFVHTDPTTGQVTTARWVRKPLTSRSRSSTTSGPCPSPIPPPSPVSSAEVRYTFSVINPLTRRHPIMASLTPNCLDILDSYTTLSPSSGRYPPTTTNRSFTPGPSDDDDSGISMPERTIQPVDETTKKLISVTGVWLALHQGWSPYYKYPVRPSTICLPETSAPGSPGPQQSPGTPVGRGRSQSAADDALKDRFRPRTRDQSPGGCSLAGRIPQRATSTGAAFMQRRTYQRQPTGFPGLATTSDASDTENGKSSVTSSTRRKLLNGEWNIPRRGGPRAPSPLYPRAEGGVEINEQEEGPAAERMSLDPGLSSAATARLERRHERRSLPLTIKSEVSTPEAADERTPRHVVDPDDTGGVMAGSVGDDEEGSEGGYFHGHGGLNSQGGGREDEQHGGVMIGGDRGVGGGVYVELEDKKRGKWKTLTGWIKKIGAR